MSIEAFLLINLTMNLTVFAISARLTGHIRWRRVLVAAALGSLYAAAAFSFQEFDWLSGIPAQMISLIALTWILFGDRCARYRRMGGLMIMLSVLVAGGVMAFLEKWIQSGGFLLILTGWPVIAAAVGMMDLWKSESQEQIDRIQLRIDTQMGSREVCALVDTGNRLHEPLSGLPVMVIGSRSLRGILDPSCLNKPSGRLPPGFRMIHYGALGGDGSMHCFRPKSVCYRQGKQWIEAPDMWIAIYPDQLPSSIEAVAPPVFAGMTGRF